ncbi:conserved Plasmodium protein, unknown function [Plasmodium malariae]|uniref:RAP domain-containing protein n=1 Tax=Plasmodium malariae TaxID=5858 RepID=A0A1A8VY40_PLAMA|nr:conserved Plasmodium protein, unknown function [Plasmodium malariae]SBS84286.1 conserved Plasmodium protein, unknown function [Plasmodium malariae]SCN12097.1 conserved Plasmodium protein, unknown function [Plasmodium malariae]
MIKRVVKKDNVLISRCRRFVYIPSQADIAKLSTKSLGNYAFDILRLSKENEGLYEMFKKKVQSEINSFDAKDCYRVLKSLEVNNKLGEEEVLIKSILHQISVQACKYSMKEICDICFLCSKLNLIYIPLFASLSVAFLNKITLASPEHISIICLSFCKIHIKDINLFNRIAVATLNILHTFDVESLINVLTSFSYLDIQKDMLLFSSVDIFIKNQNKLDANQLVKITYIYSKFYYRNNDIISMLRNKLPSHISYLNNVQLAELIISLDKLCINFYAINKFFTNVNLLHLKFPIAIKVINVLSKLHNINIEFKYDHILLCLNNFLFVHGKSSKHLNGKVKRKFLEKFNTSYGIKNGNGAFLKSDTYNDNIVAHNASNAKECKDGVNFKGMLSDYYSSYYRPRDGIKEKILFYKEIRGTNLDKADGGDYADYADYADYDDYADYADYDDYGDYENYDNYDNYDNYVNHDDHHHVVRSTEGESHFIPLGSSELNEKYYFHLNLMNKLNADSVCHLSVDMFESTCNMLLRNSLINEYEKEMKFYLNCISKEIIFLKEYLNFDCLIKLFSSLLKIPIIWNMSFLDFNIMNTIKDKCLFYINNEINFYEQLLKRYMCIFRTSEYTDNHSLILCCLFNLYNIKDKKEYSDLFKECLQYYSLIMRKGKVNNGRKCSSYIVEEISVYNFVDFYYKDIPLWNKNAGCTSASSLASHPPRNFSHNNISSIYCNDDADVYGYCDDECNVGGTNSLSQTPRSTRINKILNIELLSIVQNYNKHVKINFKDDIYYISLFEYDNYIAYVFLEPQDYFHSCNENNELKIVNTLLKRKEDKTNDSKCNSIFLINNISYNPYYVFYNDNYFIKSEILIKINYLLIKGYTIIAIPFYSWMCMNYEEKSSTISDLRKNVLNG